VGERLGRGLDLQDRMPRRHRDWPHDLADKLFAGLVHADNREHWVVGPQVYRKHVFHRRHECAVPVWRDLPVFAQVRLKFVFFNKKILDIILKM